MKKLNIILLIITTVFLCYCGKGSSNNNSEHTNSTNNDSTKTDSEQTIVVPDNVPYMTFKTNQEIGSKIHIEVKYPKDELVWIDWNNNKQLDKGEKLDSTELCSTTRSINGSYSGENMTLQNSNFTIYGAVTGLCCVEWDITDIDISNNPHLDYLALPKSIKSKLFSFGYGYRALAKKLKQQNLMPEGYHILYVASNESSDKGNNHSDKLVVFEQDIPYAKRKGEIHKKTVYFNSLGNGEYEVMGESDSLEIDNFLGDWTNLSIRDNKIVYTEYNTVTDDVNWYDWLTIKDGKILETPNLRATVPKNNEGVYEVKSDIEFIGSIASNRTIKIMSPQIRIEGEMFDTVIDSVKNLTIKGGLDKKSRIIPNSNSDLVFTNCENIKLNNVNLGYLSENSEMGCGEQVLKFVSCTNVELDNILFNNCGVVAISIFDTYKLSCTNSTFENDNADFSLNNAISISNSRNLLFDNVIFKNNKLRGALIKDEGSNNVIFQNCKMINNSCGSSSKPDFLIFLNEESNGFVFDKVEIKDNKGKELTNITDESVIKFTER